MSEEDYILIEGNLYELAELIGASDAVSNEHYYQDSEGGHAENLMPAKARVIAKLHALDRHLAMMDKNTFVKSMEKLNQALRSPEEKTFKTESGLPLNAAVVVPPGEPGYDLVELTSLSEMRAELRELAQEMEEDTYE